MKKDFLTLDNAIMTAILEGRKDYTSISYRVEGLARAHTTRKDWMRVVDRRLQALRKRGLISFGRKEWSLNPSDAPQ